MPDGLLDASEAAEALGVHVSEFLRLATEHGVTHSTSNIGRHYEIGDVKKLAMKLAALAAAARDEVRAQQFRVAVKILHDRQ